MRWTSVFAALACCGLIFGLPKVVPSAHAEGRAMRPDIMPVKDLKKGMKGYGLTVFEGTTPERFEVELIGVLDNFRPNQELILIKTKHPRLEVAKVVAGMSGSPIFINDKMIGAYAYGWTFGEEPVAGVTPIRNMLDDMAIPIPKELNGIRIGPLPTGKERKSGKTASLGKGRYQGDATHYDVNKHAQQVARRANALSGGDTSLKAVQTPLLMGGIGGESMALAKELLGPLGLEPMQAGGGGKQDPNAPKRFVDGSAVGIELIRGDMSATGLGTVTRVEGDKLVAFGHPMSQNGISLLPTAIGEIKWFLATKMRSFKLGMPVRTLGAMVNDRQASIVVSHSTHAPTIPVHMTIKGADGAPKTDWSFEIAHDRFMTPAFMAVALGSAMEATSTEQRDVSWTARAKLKVKGYGEVRLEDHGVSLGSSPSAQDFARSDLVRGTGAVLNNPWHPAQIESAEMEMELRFTRELVRLRGVDLLTPEVNAGQNARIRLTLEPYEGNSIVRTLSIPIPKSLAGETVRIAIAPGYTVSRVKPAPETLAQLIKNFEDPVYPARTVVATYSTGATGVSYKGRIANNLPPGAFDALQPTSTSVTPDSFAGTLDHVFPLPVYMTGTDSVAVTVRPILR